MICKINSTGEVLSISLKGRLTFTDYNAFKQIVDLIGIVKQQQCIFDLENLEYIDSAGLGMFLLSREKSQENDGNITLKSPTGYVKKMLELGKFENLFTITSEILQ